MAAYLTIADGLGDLKRFELQKPVFTLGRHADNDLRIPGSSVSRRHAEIITEADNFILVDKESKGGTYVNEEPIVRRQLQHLDRIRLGGSQEFEIQFIDERFLAGTPDLGSTPAPVQAKTSFAHVELQNLARFLEVNQALKISLSLEEVLSLIVDAAIEITQADRGALLLRDDAGGLEFRMARDRNLRTIPSQGFAMTQAVLDRALRSGRSVIASDSRTDSFLRRECLAVPDLRTVVCLPLQRFRVDERVEATVADARETLGVLYLDSRQSTDSLSKASLKLLESLAFEASKALESVRLIQQEEEKQRLERELATAREVQLSLLTSSRLNAAHIEIAAHSIPSRHVDGDFYDLLPLADGRIAVVLGDVSGKGLSAALLAAMAQGILDTQLSAGLPVATIMSNLNALLLRKSPSWRFITLFCGLLEKEGRFTFVNAGHNPPVLLRTDGQVEYLSSDSMVVGALDIAVYTAREVRLAAGDLVLAFTDGLTEAADASGEMYGDDRLLTLLRSAAALSAEDIMNRVLEHVASFTRGLPQEDDITVIALKAKSAP